MRVSPQAPDITAFFPDEMPVVRVLVLANNIKVYYIEDRTQEVVRIEFILPAGIAAEKRPVTASATNAMLQEGTINHSARELNEIIDYHGAFIGTNFDSDNAGLVSVGLTKHFEKLVELSSEMIFTSVFPEEELQIYLERRLESFRIQKSRVNHIATTRFQEYLFGTDHPYGRRVEEMHFKSISGRSLKEFHADFYNPSNLSIIVSGLMPVNGADIFDKYIGSFSCQSCNIVHPNQLDFSYKGGSERIKRKDSVQAAIKIGRPVINKLHPDYKGLKIVATILGGYFGSRLMKNIREDKGFSYGISAGISSMIGSGYFIVSTEVANKYVKDTLKAIYHEMNTLRTIPIEKRELELVQNYLYGDIMRLFDGPFTTAETLRSMLVFGLDFSYFSEMSDKIRNISPDEIIYLAKTYLPEENMTEIVAG